MTIQSENLTVAAGMAMIAAIFVLAVLGMAEDLATPPADACLSMGTALHNTQ